MNLTYTYTSTDRDGTTRWRIRLANGPESFETDYSMGSAHKGEPDLADVLRCLLSDYDAGAEPTYEGFASAFGYDPDSRKGEAVYMACKRTKEALDRLYTSTELDTLREKVQE